MYIVSLAGVILASFDKWDVRSVAKAEQWIKDHNCFIWKCEMLNGAYYVIVKECY